MPDDQKQPEGGTPEAGDHQEQDQLPDNFDELKLTLNRERAARRDAEKRARRAGELETRLQQLEDQGKSESEKLSERASAAEKAAADASVNYLRLKVGTTKGLDPEVADRLRGANEEEMAADADRLLAVLRPKQPDGASFDGGARKSTPDGDFNSALRRLINDG